MYSLFGAGVLQRVSKLTVAGMVLCSQTSQWLLGAKHSRMHWRAIAPGPPPLTPPSQGGDFCKAKAREKLTRLTASH